MSFFDHFPQKFHLLSAHNKRLMEFTSPKHELEQAVEDAFSFANHWKNVKRVAYAASFATSEWEFSEQQTECCKTLAKKFDGISVREESGSVSRRELNSGFL